MGRKKKEVNPQGPAEIPAPAENPLIKKETTNLNLECTLTADETVKYARAMGEKLNKKKAYEDAAKSFSTQSKADIAACDAEINRLNGLITTGKEYRMIECEVISDLEKKTKTTIRKDTGAVERVDPLSEAECQMELPKPPDAPAVETAKTDPAAPKLASNICDTCATERNKCVSAECEYKDGVIIKCTKHTSGKPAGA